MYLKIGSRLYRKWKNLPPDDPDKTELERFLKIYEQAPLFLVGFSDEDLIVQGIEPQWLDFFKPPYPQMLLQYPKATYKPIFNTENPVSVMIYLAEYQDRYHVEVLVPGEDFLVPEMVQKIARGFNVSPDEAIRLATKVSVINLLSFVFKIEQEDFDVEVNVIHNTTCKNHRSSIYPDLPKPERFVVCKGCDNPDEVCKELPHMAQYFVYLIVKTIAFINQPQNYIVKETVPLTPREERLKGKSMESPEHYMPYFAKKPRHIVLDYSGVKELLRRSKEPARSHSSPLPHKRRGHWRFLRAEKFKEKRYVWVRPADVNAGMRFQIGKVVYEVVK
jgi:hypothetical protein